MNPPFVLRFHHPKDCLAGSHFGFGFEIENSVGQEYSRISLTVFHANEEIQSWEFLEPCAPGNSIVQSGEVIQLHSSGTSGIRFRLSACMGDRLTQVWTGNIEAPMVWPEIDNSRVTIKGNLIVAPAVIEGENKTVIGGYSEKNEEIFERQRDQCSTAPQLKLSIDDTVAHPFEVYLPNGKSQKFCPIPKGVGRVGGTPSNDRQSDYDEVKSRKIRFHQPFWMARTPVTVGQYLAVTGIAESDLEEIYKSRCRNSFNPQRLHSEAPVAYLNWEEAAAFCETLTNLEYRRGDIPSAFSYRLPTEEEWEYACRAGSDAPYHGAYEEIAWTGSSGAVRVGMKSPNSFGLHDMQGFFWQWCSEGDGIEDSDCGVCRGGAFTVHRRFAKASSRQPVPKDRSRGSIGFRPVLVWE